MEQTSSANMETYVGELIKGRDLSNSLQNLLGQNIDDDGPVSAENLVMNIQESFSNSLQNLSLFSAGESGMLPTVPLSTYVGSASSGDKTYDSGKSEKKRAPVVKDRRGSYKRRMAKDSWVKIVGTTEDGYMWRKYGQKAILNAKFERCYFRCTYRNSSGCAASKQVQKLDDGSQMYHITYYWHHTCMKIHKNELMISDSGAPSFSLLNFEVSKTNHLPTGPSTIMNIHITPSTEQEVNSSAQSVELIASGNFGQSTIALWNDVSENGSSVNDLTFSESSCCRFDY